MKVGILLFEQIHGKTNLGSSRIRGHWLVKYWPEAEIYQQGAKYDVIIFQKVYWLSGAKAFKGIKILDICDPDWLDMSLLPEFVVGMIDNCDAVTTSTEALRDEIKKFTDKPVVYIPDRQDLEFHNKKKLHTDPATSVIWFGYSHNAKVLDKTIGLLKKHNLELSVLSECRPPYSKADRNFRYEWDNPDFDFNDIILQHDIVLMPENQSPRGRFKSLNKTYIAWALGMPVATTPEDLIRFLDPEERQKEAVARFREVQEKYDIKQSVKDFQDLIATIKEGKVNGD